MSYPRGPRGGGDSKRANRDEPQSAPRCQPGLAGETPPPWLESVLRRSRCELNVINRLHDVLLPSVAANKVLERLLSQHFLLLFLLPQKLCLWREPNQLLAGVQ